MPPRTSVTDPQAPEEVGNLENKMADMVGGDGDRPFSSSSRNPDHTHPHDQPVSRGKTKGGNGVLDVLQAEQSSYWGLEIFTQ